MVRLQEEASSANPLRVHRWGIEEAAEINGKSSSERRQMLAKLLRRDSENAGLHPLSFAQQRLWFLEQFEAGTAVHNLSSGLRLYGELDISVLQRAVDDIVARHETLRTTFVDTGSEVFQRVLSAAPVNIPVLDLRRAPEHQREREAYDWAYSESRRPFDLESGPLLRINVVRIRDDDHVLLITMHHLVSDGWSMAVFVQEVSGLYTAHGENRPCVLLPLLPIQYSDYARWQRGFFPRDELDRQLHYWKTKLAGIPSALELSSDRVRPSEQTFSGATCSAMLSSALRERLTSFAQCEEVTLFMVLLASFSVLLHRYSHQEDICIGVPVAGRELLETEPLIGLFANALVIRTDLSANPRFCDVLAQTRDLVLGAYANQEIPFERVVEELHPQRSLSHNPLFQVMMTMFQAPRCDQRFGALTAAPYVIGTSTSRFDLTVSVIEAANGSIWCQFEYNTGLFDQARISRMMDHFQMLLSSLADDPEQAIGDLELLTADERRQIAARNDTAVEYAIICVHDLIARQAGHTPERVAVTCEGRQLTYAALMAQAEGVASALIAAGECPGSHIAICLERSVEVVAGLLGILHIGAAYVPMDPNYPTQRLSLMIEDAGVSTVLTSRNIAARLPASVRRIFIEDAPQAPRGAGQTLCCNPESLCYLIYTSGSTGTPKGVCVSHRALANVLHSMRNEPGFTAHDKLLAVTSLTFDISGVELFLPLTCGGQVVIATRAEVLDGRRLLELIRQHAITVLQATPSTWRLLIEAGWNRETGRIRVWCGGEALTDDFAGELLERSDEVWNLYGPTETTIWSSVSRVQERQPVTLGRPIANTQFYVLDRRLRPVPVGVAGELYIGGRGLAEGYWGRQDLTREKFVPCPFPETSGRLYRTGDEVRYGSNWEIEYIRRLDFQVKVRGRRIELAEIETALCKYPGVRQAVTIVREDTPGDPRLVAYVVPERGKALLPSSLRTNLKDRLPEYMIPRIVLLDTMPLTDHDKIDRTRLPVPHDENHPRGRIRNALERRMLAIWEQVLRIDGIGLTDNFFELGGHSLLAIRLLANIEKTFGKRLPVSTFLKAQTVEEMAAVLGEDLSLPTSSLVEMQRGGPRPPLFLFPGAGGDVLGYAGLPPLLDSDQPVYGLRSVGLDGDRKPLEHIAEIAEHFLGEIRRLQPHGPYQLVGFCIGGITAFEIAQRLVACGEEVSLLAVIETWPPSCIPVHQPTSALLRLVSLARAAPRHLGAMRGVLPREALRYFRQKIAMIRDVVLPERIDSKDHSSHQSELVTRANHRAGAQYVPSRYPGRILLFIPTDESMELDRDPRLVWGTFAEKGCRVINITGDRGNLLSRPHVQVLAANLMGQLRESQSRVVAAAG
jgi:amino acid adenylation domain-containing protein